ncbi:MAG: type II secretion system GspH family protein [Vampirovibrio sp.]|nr:type II secretion system GspH family protein [Vampirovibrio sp.]
MTHASSKGFTLAELLIALAILGVIATFTIPKILDAGSSSKNSAVAKEAASMISGAYQSFKLNSTAAATTTPGTFTQYMNYVATTTATGFSIGPDPQGLDDCTAPVVCLQLHNGGILAYDSTNTFGGTANTNAVYFNVDPDGDATGAGAATFIQYFNGRLTTGQNILGSTATGVSSVTLVTTDPSWIATWN